MLSRGVGRVKNLVQPGGGASTPIVPGRVWEGGTSPDLPWGVGECRKLPHRGLGLGHRSQHTRFEGKNSRKICTNYVKTCICNVRDNRCSE